MLGRGVHHAGTPGRCAPRPVCSPWRNPACSSTVPGTERDLSIWEIRLIVVVMTPLSGCCARLATAGPAPSASGPTAGPSTRELLVRPAPQRTTLRCASNLLAGAALRHRDRFGIAVAVGALIGSTVRRWFRGVRDPHTQWLYRRAWTAPAARPCNAQPCPSLCRPRSADTRPGIVTTPSTQSLR